MVKRSRFKFKDWQAAVVLFITGLITFFSGLRNPFEGDDLFQIVQNTPIHSISNFKLFFEHGTFYTGNSSQPLSGAYYRPLMSSVNSLIWTIFGGHALYFHLVQMLLSIGSAFFVYLIFKTFFKSYTALFLSLVFLVHPINSQAAFAIPTMQDALYIFFGLLASWVYIRFDSIKSLAAVGVLLLLALFSKETALGFIIMLLIYSFIWDRKRFKYLALFSIIPAIIWFLLRHSAVGITKNPNNAPIDSLSFSGRIETIPSVLLLYIEKFLVPTHLAVVYMWVHPGFSFKYFWLPIFIILFLISLIVLAGIKIKKYGHKNSFYGYLYFLIWTLVGLVFIVQIIPLDATASVTWLYFPIIGLLGLIGLMIDILLPRIKLDSRLIGTMAVLILATMIALSANHGTDWKNQNYLATYEAGASADDFQAYSILATNMLNSGHPKIAAYYASKSIRIYPEGTNYVILALAQDKLGKYSDSLQSDINGLNYAVTYQSEQLLYDNASRLMVWYGDPSSNQQFILKGLQKYHKDPTLWLNLAVIAYESGNKFIAKVAIKQLVKYAPSKSNLAIYNAMYANEKLKVAPISSTLNK